MRAIEIIFSSNNYKWMPLGDEEWPDGRKAGWTRSERLAMAMLEVLSGLITLFTFGRLGTDLTYRYSMDVARQQSTQVVTLDGEPNPFQC
jgi:hypothetical protein